MGSPIVGSYKLNQCPEMDRKLRMQHAYNCDLIFFMHSKNTPLKAQNVLALYSDSSFENLFKKNASLSRWVWGLQLWDEL
jgi:hypothetical protein